MKFFKKELCIKLQKLKCAASNVAWWRNDYPNNPSIYKDIDYITFQWPYTYKPKFIKYGGLVHMVDAFSIYDFLSDEDYAEENCKNVFRQKWRRGRLDLLWAKNQESYIEEAVDKVLCQ